MLTYSSELYGGPSQPPLGDPRGSVAKSHRLAETDKRFKNPGQYDNEDVSPIRLDLILFGLTSKTDTYTELAKPHTVDRATTLETTSGDQHNFHVNGLRRMHYRNWGLLKKAKAICKSFGVSTFQRSVSIAY